MYIGFSRNEASKKWGPKTNISMGLTQDRSCISVWPHMFSVVRLFPAQISQTSEVHLLLDHPCLILKDLVTMNFVIFIIWFKKNEPNLLPKKKKYEPNQN